MPMLINPRLSPSDWLPRMNDLGSAISEPFVPQDGLGTLAKTLRDIATGQQQRELDQQKIREGEMVLAEKKRQTAADAQLQKTFQSSFAPEPLTGDTEATTLTDDEYDTQRLRNTIDQVRALGTPEAMKAADALQTRIDFKQQDLRLKEMGTQQRGQMIRAKVFENVLKNAKMLKSLPAPILKGQLDLTDADIEALRGLPDDAEVEPEIVTDSQTGNRYWKYKTAKGGYALKEIVDYNAKQTRAEDLARLRGGLNPRIVDIGGPGGKSMPTQVIPGTNQVRPLYMEGATTPPPALNVAPELKPVEGAPGNIPVVNAPPLPVDLPTDLQSGGRVSVAPAPAPAPMPVMSPDKPVKLPDVGREVNNILGAIKANPDLKRFEPVNVVASKLESEFSPQIIGSDGVYTKEVTDPGVQDSILLTQFLSAFDPKVGIIRPSEIDRFVNQYSLPTRINQMALKTGLGQGYDVNGIGEMVAIMTPGMRKAMLDAMNRLLSTATKQMAPAYREALNSATSDTARSRVHAAIPNVIRRALESGDAPDSPVASGSAMIRTEGVTKDTKPGPDEELVYSPSRKQWAIRKKAGVQ